MQVIQANLQFTGPLIPLNPENVLSILLHHAEAVYYTPEQCHRDHMANGWSGAGYNEYIRKDGTVYTMRGDNIGAQCQGYNSKSYGICVEGNYHPSDNKAYDTEMPQAQFEALVERILFHKTRFPNLIDIAPHSKYFPTTCPGDYFPLQQVYDAVADGGVIKQVDTESWKHEGINYLAQEDLLDSPDQWHNQVNQPMPVWATTLILARIHKSMKG